MTTYYCPHSGICDIYKSMPQSELNPMRLDIIEQTQDRYRCLAFDTAKELRRRDVGTQCSNIVLLNLMELQRGKK